MAITGINLLLLIVLYTGGSLVGGTVASFILGYPSATLSLLGGAVAVLGLSWPIYKHFRFRPLCLPRCHHCHRMPETYGVAYAEWPLVVVICTACNAPTELWMTRTVNINAVSTETPSFYLRWPEFIGLWRRVHQTTDDLNQQALEGSAEPADAADDASLRSRGVS